MNKLLFCIICLFLVGCEKTLYKYQIDVENKTSSDLFLVFDSQGSTDSTDLSAGEIFSFEREKYEAGSLIDVSKCPSVDSLVLYNFKDTSSVHLIVKTYSNNSVLDSVLHKSYESEVEGDHEVIVQHDRFSITDELITQMPKDYNMLVKFKNQYVK